MFLTARLNRDRAKSLSIPKVSIRDLMAGAAAAGRAPGTRGSPWAARAAAGSSLIPAALESEYRHHALGIPWTAFGTGDRFVASKDERLEFVAAITTLIFINGHRLLPPGSWLCFLCSASRSLRPGRCGYF